MKWKKILTYIGLGLSVGALLFTFLGLGFGVGYRYAHNETNMIVTTTPVAERLNNKKYKPITPNASEDNIKKDKTYIFVLKNYEDDGEDVLWSEDFNLDGAAVSQASANNGVASGTFIVGDRASYGGISFSTTLWGGVRKINYIDLDPISVNNNSRWRIVSFTQDTGRVVSDAKSFIVKDFYPVNSAVYIFINQFYWVYEIEDDQYTFNFNENFNYNAPYNTAFDSGFISDSHFTSSNAGYVVRKYISFPRFISNGMLFDGIYLYYNNAYGSRYNENNTIISSEGIGYYSMMFYDNSITGFSKLVNNRVYSSIVDSSGNVQVGITNRATWVNPAFKYLVFERELSNVQTDNLTIFNNNVLNVSGGVTSDNNDIGLGSAFTLIGQAFASMKDILAISVLPGISLGLLLFLPLIAGIIIFVIWIVKR